MIKLSPPTCLKSYRVRPITDEEADHYEMHGDLFTRYQLACPCGCNQFDIIHFSGYEECPQSPLYTRCGQCHKKELLFDSDLHGHDAMIGDPISAKGTSKETTWTCPACREVGQIIVAFGYQYCEEDFSELDTTGHIEDYFDALLVFHVCTDNHSLHSVAWYECA